MSDASRNGTEFEATTPVRLPGARGDRTQRPVRRASATLRLAALLALSLSLAAVCDVSARQAAGPQQTPLRQSSLTAETAGAPRPLTIRDASRDDRWLGVGVRDVRWGLDGDVVYFRWHPDPSPEDDPAADPWYRVDRDGRGAERVPDTETHAIPPVSPDWSLDGQRAVWTSGGRLYLWEAARRGPGTVRIAYAGGESASGASFRQDGRTVHLTIGGDLHAFDVETGELRRLTRTFRPSTDTRTDAARWLQAQQLELFEHHRREAARREAAAERRRLQEPVPAQPIPVPDGTRLMNVQLSPDGNWVTFRRIRTDRRRPNTQYMDYVTESGYAEARNARAKVGEPRDEVRFGVVAYDPSVDPESVQVNWIELPEAEGRPTVVHGPYWSLEGDAAVLQILSQDHKDYWIARYDPATGRTTVIDHQHDPAWIGGQPIMAGRLFPGLLEWLPGGRFVFASERTGWSHLYLAERDGRVRPLTSGEWEVRLATLSRDRSRWLITAGREDPADDHLYVMPAAGGELVRLTEAPGRHNGWLSPDGARLAVVYSEQTQLPDLFVRDPRPGAREARVTVSGTDNFHRHAWVRPEIVRFTHTDGRPLWAALFQPTQPNPERAAVIHIHGGGYRQFAHRGWSVYGYANHIAMINYLVQEGYTVLDFDYRGSSGFGRDYRTDIYRQMGVADIDGAVTAVDYLVREHGIDRSRVGIYGLSYGGFFTLMAQFRHPGVFAAGVAKASVTDWAHYNETYTARILNLPYDDDEAYRRASPIYHAGGLQDPLLIVHGIVDDNVHLQDVIRLTQRLIELEKDFEIMYYPLEPHTIQSEPARYDYHRRMAAFFERHLLRRGDVRRALAPVEEGVER